MIESGRFQNGSLTLVKNKTKPDTWFLRFYRGCGEQACLPQKANRYGPGLPASPGRRKGGFGPSRKHQQRC